MFPVANVTSSSNLIVFVRQVHRHCNFSRVQREVHVFWSFVWWPKLPNSEHSDH